MPPHKQEAYSVLAEQSYPIMEGIHRTVISLPIYSVMTQREIEQVTDVINFYQQLLQVAY